MKDIRLTPCKWSQFGASDLILLVRRFYPLMPVTKIAGLPDSTLRELMKIAEWSQKERLRAKAK